MGKKRVVTSKIKGKRKVGEPSENQGRFSPSSSEESSASTGERVAIETWAAYAVANPQTEEVTSARGLDGERDVKEDGREPVEDELGADEDDVEEE